MKILTTVISNFEAAHFLRNENLSIEENLAEYGKCNNLHGHNYKVFVTVQGEISENGMLINFSELKKIVKLEIINAFDHQLLNNIMNDIPTVENMCLLFWNVLQQKLNKPNIDLYEIKVFETETSYAAIRRTL